MTEVVQSSSNPGSAVVGDEHILQMITKRWGGHGGGVAVQRALGVSSGTASHIRRGMARLDRAAAYFGYIRSGDHQWRKSDRPIDIAAIGRRSWTDEDLDRIRRLRAQGLTRSRIAQRIGCTPGSIDNAIRRHLGEQP